jgi:hypothetical protein
MKTIKISHEVPLCLLEESLTFCDYQYALPHLLESNETYRLHFLRCKNKGVEIYMDNSLHELGHSMDADVLLKWIDILEPSNFFIPDVWEDCTASMVNAKYWSKIQLPKNTTKVAVVQAKSINEAIRCTQTYIDLGYEKIAYSYGASYYNDIYPHINKDLGKALGRLKMISTLYSNGVLLPTSRVHLLGTACPIEFSLYKGIKCIESVDTSNPIMAAVDGIKYNNLGTHSKPKSNMNSCSNIDYKDINMELLNHNVKTFKNIIKTNNMDDNKQNAELMSLYDYLKKPAGAELGKKVYEYARRTNQAKRIQTREISNSKYKGTVLLYPKHVLDQYFAPEEVIDLPF